MYNKYKLQSSTVLYKVQQLHSTKFNRTVESTTSAKHKVQQYYTKYNKYKVQQVQSIKYNSTVQSTTTTNYNKYKD